MPIELKITGDTPQAFWQNAAHAFLLLAQGGNTVFAQPSAGTTSAASAPAETASMPDVPAVELVAEENPKVMAEPKQRKKREKAPETIDVKPNEVVDEDPLGLNDVIEPAEQTYTLDDMRQCVKDIIAAGTARGWEMTQNVAYVKKLFAPFGVKLAAEVKPEQFADFIAAAKPYLDGSAK